MEFIINGNSYEINNLSEEIDKAFLDLNAAFLGNASINIDEFYQKAYNFFDEFQNDHKKHDGYFSNFTIIWKRFLTSNNFYKAENIWKIAIKPALEWESKNDGLYIHKGTAFYFWGMTAIQNMDIDKGYTLMHRALQEDERRHGTPTPNTPPFSFAILDVFNVNQAFYEWIATLAQYLEKYIKQYNHEHDRHLNLNIFRDRFLRNLNNIDTNYLFAYNLAKIYNLDKIPKYVLTNRFSSQIESNLLFDLTLIIDSSLRTKNPTQWKFIDQIAFLSKKAQLFLNKKELQNINASFNSDFEKTLKNLLDTSFKLKTGINTSKFASYLAIAYGVRNVGAHSIEAQPIIWKKFEEIKTSLFNVLFLIVETLY